VRKVVDEHASTSRRGGRVASIEGGKSSGMTVEAGLLRRRVKGGRVDGREMERGGLKGREQRACVMMGGREEHKSVEKRKRQTDDGIVGRGPPGAG
jgi:hypothetical protein